MTRDEQQTLDFFKEQSIKDRVALGKCRHKYIILRDALKQIANIDYRGNAHQSKYLAEDALKRVWDD
jgi:hypothetical protein